MFKKSLDLRKINEFSKNSMVGNLGIEIIEIGKKPFSRKLFIDSAPCLLLSLVLSLPNIIETCVNKG